MKQLTKGEEQIMHIIWELGNCTVSQIIATMPDPKPPHSSISSIVRILEKKGFVNHKTYGRTHDYFAIVAKKDYSKLSLKKLVTGYFDGSMNQLVSFMVKENDMSVDELNNLLEQLKSSKDD